MSQKKDGVLIRECCHTCMSSFDIEIMLVIKIIKFLTQTVFKQIFPKKLHHVFNCDCAIFNSRAHE